jgi:hypothetical protein
MDDTTAKYILEVSLVQKELLEDHSSASMLIYQLNHLPFLISLKTSLSLNRKFERTLSLFSRTRVDVLPQGSRWMIHARTDLSYGEDKQEGEVRVKG